VDKLKLYAFLMLLATWIISLIYIIICRRQYEECRFRFYWNKALFQTLLHYSGWNLFGAISAMANDQGMNLLLNFFFGPVINASRAVAFRVNSAISSFSYNFYMAVNPQIIKSYATGDRQNMIKLVFRSSKFAYFLLFLLSMPILLELKFVLTLWLKNIDHSMVVFTRLAIIYALVLSLENPLTQAARSTGRIKKYQISVGSITLLALPIAYCLLKLGFLPESTMYVLIVTYFVAIFLRLWVLKELVNFPVSEYVKQVLLRIILVSLIAGIMPALALLCLEKGLLRFLLVAALSAISVLGSVYGIGLTARERAFTNHTVWKGIHYIKQSFWGKNGA
jgi:O-antigen/teichoic acid export membrane protein